MAQLLARSPRGCVSAVSSAVFFFLFISEPSLVAAQGVITPTTINTMTISQVVATEYFVNQRLALYSCGGAHWADCGAGKGGNVTTVVIDGE